MRSTVSIMHCWKNSLHRLTSLLAFLLLAGCTADDEDKSFIALNQASARITGDNEIEIQASLNHRFSAAVVEALENGVRMQFRYSLRISHEDENFWDGPVWSQDGYREVAYRSLSERFTIATIPPGDTNSVDTMDLLQTELDEFSLTLPLTRNLTDIEALRLEIRFDLDINSLPPPLKLPSYLSPDWHMDSDWLKIRIAG